MNNKEFLQYMATQNKVKKGTEVFEKFNTQSQEALKITMELNNRYHTPEEIVGAMCQAELSHEVIVIFSFLPLLTVPAFGAFWVFLITSVLSAMIDLSFAIMQRYNRPRIMKLCKRRKKN